MLSLCEVSCGKSSKAVRTFVRGGSLVVGAQPVCFEEKNSGTIEENVVHLLLPQEDFEKVVDHRVDSLSPDEVDKFMEDIVEGRELVSVVFWCNELVLKPL